MIFFRTISSFRKRLATLLKVKRNVYGGVENEIRREFSSTDINQIRINNDMVLMVDDNIVIKLRLPDKKQRLSKKDAFRLIYLVSKKKDLVVFLDIYPKNGPLQQLDISRAEIGRLVKEFVEEANSNSLEGYSI
ncbi:MAG: hypothetical protein LUD17_15515 [Bacteroidales bacterium]|nr:hypothetical protein [Bacteroidales bacterium]